MKAFLFEHRYTKFDEKLRPIEGVVIIGWESGKKTTIKIEGENTADFIKIIHDSCKLYG